MTQTSYNDSVGASDRRFGHSLAMSPPISEYDSSEDTDSQSDDSDGSDSQPGDLDEPWDYIFRFRETVWVRTTGGAWHEGKIFSSRTKTCPTRQGMGTYYPVKFYINKNHIAKDFAPLNGEIKPDTPHVRNLLKAGGWL